MRYRSMVKTARIVVPCPGRRDIFRGKVFFAGLLVCLLAPGAQVFAQLPGQLPERPAGTQTNPQAVAAGVNDAEPLPDTIRQKLNDVRIRQQEVRTVLAGKSPPSYASFDELSAWQIQLFATRTALESWLITLDRIRQTQQAGHDLESKIQGWSGFGIDEPYPLSLADQLAAELHSKQLELQTEQTRTELEEGLVPDFRKALDLAGPKLRRAAEAYEMAQDDNEARLRWLLESAEDEQEAAGARLQAALAKIELNRQRVSLLKREIEFLEEKQKRTAGKIEFTRAYLDTRLEAIAQHRERLQRQLAEVEQQSSLAREREANARASLEKELAGEGRDQARFRQLFELRQIEAETTSERVETLKLLLTANGLETILWQGRFRVHAGLKENQALDEIIQNLENWQKRVRGFDEYYSSKVLLARTQVQNQNETLSNWPEHVPGKQIELAKRSAYQERMNDLQQLVASVETLEFQLDRLKAEASSQTAARSFLERLQFSLATALRNLSLVWNYEIFSVDDTIIAEGRVISGSRPVTLKKLIYGLLLLTIGIWLVGKVAKLLSRLAQQRLKVERSLILLFEKVGQYLAIFVVVIAALGLVQIPFTAFAFLGGALAIGVGFGGQNLINNFMSSLILLIEKPIKVSDMVEVEGVLGRVTAIGGRCSTIRRFDGVDLLVPNSHLLEKTVVNRTLADKFVRYEIKVGVAYGSPTREVFRILEQVVDEHGLVLKEPSPVVVLEDFAADALLFGIYYWLEVNERLDSRVIASDLRHRIDRLFRDAGICIAFPQRDVHLDTEGPLKIQLIAEQQSIDQPAKTATTAEDPEKKLSRVDGAKDASRN